MKHQIGLALALTLAVAAPLTPPGRLLPVSDIKDWIRLPARRRSSL